MEVIREQFQAAEVVNLEMEIGSANLEVEAAEGIDEVQIEVQKDPGAVYESSVEDGTLSISYEWKQKLFRNNKSGGSRIRLVLPQDKKFGRVAIEFGAGNVTIGALLMADTMDVEVGAGNMKLGNVRARKANVELGAGKFQMSGKVETELNVDCGVGDCRIDLEGNEADYNYEISCGIGKVSLNGNSMKSMGNHEKRTAGAAGMIHVDCGVGSVNINIK